MQKDISTLFRCFQRKKPSLKISVLGPVKIIPIISGKMQSCILHILRFGTHSNNLDESPEDSAEWEKKKKKEANPQKLHTV